MNRVPSSASLPSADRWTRLAKISYWLACLGPLSLVEMALVYPPLNPKALPPLPWQALWWALSELSPAGIALGILALAGLRPRSLRHHTGYPYALAGIILGIVASASIPYGVNYLNGIRMAYHHGHISCLSKVKQLNLALQMYIQDYDERFPVSASWNGGTFPYIKSEAAYRCPEEFNDSVPSYAVNGRLQMLLLDKVESPEGTVLLFDSIPGKNLAGGKDLLPSPPRHTIGDIGCDNFGFVDGHVKTYKLTELDTMNWDPRKRLKTDGQGK